ncbi:hypothetical protein QYF61_021553 [Mycteria americana]|uniref:Homeobox-containing protein 1 n=1 Tax=Mycteria americana TaxID=33587 RepID=A0AAN7PEM6_MYCAM|nr:hypothetical protein QYF61_021553 [Mycteria americana]
MPLFCCGSGLKQNKKRERECLTGRELELKEEQKLTVNEDAKSTNGYVLLAPKPGSYKAKVLLSLVRLRAAQEAPTVGSRCRSRLSGDGVGNRALLETMSHYTDEPRFTIEQIDLLQRLRRTGMTRHEILHALETLDRLDQEHSDKFGRRSSYGGGSYSNSTNNVPASSSTATASTQTQHSGMSPSPSNSYDTSPQPCTTNQNGRESNERLSAFNGKMSPTRYPLANSLAQRSYSFEASEEDLDIDDKVEELMRRDSSVIKEEIKAFLANRRISQAVVAQVTGISQSRISHWLLQQGSDLSEQKKRAFYRWYQLEKTNPGATLSMRPAPIPIEEPEWRQTPPPVTATSGTFRLRRGSRFTWRKECLAVMESPAETKHSLSLISWLPMCFAFPSTYSNVSFVDNIV